MAIREKQAWVTVGTALAIWPFYFYVVLSSFVARELDGWALLEVFLWCAAAHAVAAVALTWIVTRMAREPFDAPLDERERLFEGRSMRLGMWLLQLAVLALVVASPWISEVARTEFAADPAGATAIVMANAMVLAGALAGIADEVALIVQYRMTASS